MTVIINDFEVVAEPAPTALPQAGTPSPNPVAPAPSSTPRDIERIIRRQIERCVRVRAH